MFSEHDSLVTAMMPSSSSCRNSWSTC